MSELLTKICPKCGIKFKTDNRMRKYCSESCSNRDRLRETGDFDASLNWVKTGDSGTWECPYNMGVACSARWCSTCGWNPEVAEARKKAMEKAYGCI